MYRSVGTKLEPQFKRDKLEIESVFASESFALCVVPATAVIAAVFDQIHFHLNTNTNNAVLFAAFEFVDIQMEKLPSAFHLTVITSNCAFSVTYLLTLLSLSPSFAFLD